MQYIGKLNLENIGEYREKAITSEVILTDERLNEHGNKQLKIEVI